MIESIGSLSAQNSVSGLSRSEGLGSASNGGGQRGHSSPQTGAVHFGDVLTVSSQGRAQAQAAQQYRQQSTQGSQPDIDGLIKQAQQQAQQQSAQQATYTAQSYTSTGVAFNAATRQEGYLHGQLQNANPQRAAATYRTMQARGTTPTSLAPWGTGISITV